MEPDDHLTLYNVACVYSLLGELDQAIDLLERFTLNIQTRIPQMDCQFDDLFEQFCCKNQCNTIIAPGQIRLTRRVNPESLT